MKFYKLNSNHMLNKVILFCVLPAIILSQQAVIKGCYYQNLIKKRCSACYRRQKQANGPGCGPLLPVTDTCLIHYEAPGEKLQCGLCREGYGLTLKDTCVPSNMFNCVSSGVYPGENDKSCFSCGRGLYPDSNYEYCLPAPEGKGVEHCEWGTLINSQTIKCNKCSPGYILNFENTACVPIVPHYVGCLQMEGFGRCISCNVYAGYSMQIDGTCKFVAHE